MFQGWRVVGGSFVYQAFVIGFFTYAVGMLTQPVRETFGVGIEDVMYSLTLGNFLGLITMPLAGSMLDRVSARKLVSGGLVFFALGISLAAYSQNLLQYVLAIGISMAVVTAFAGPMVAAALASRWFTVSRGKALGISAIGTSVGGVLVPALIAWWLPEHGWRNALLYLAVVLIVFVLPVVLFTIRGWPADLGLEPEPPADMTAPPSQGMLGVRQILSMSSFWWISLSLGLLFCGYGAILSVLMPYVTGLGYSEETASLLIMTVAVSSILGKLLFGIAADRFSRRVSLWAAQLFAIIGACVLALEPPFAAMMMACFFLGFGGGGMLPVWGTLTAEVFGLASYGQAMGLMGPVITLCVMPGFPLAGRLHDLTGNFILSFYVLAGFIVVAALLLLPLRLPRPQQAATTAA